jgi:hypothetical protein
MLVVDFDDLVCLEDDFAILVEADGSTTFATASAGERSPFFNGCTSASPSETVVLLDAALVEFSLGVVGRVLAEISLGVGGRGFDLVERFFTDVVSGGGRRFGGMISMLRADDDK